MANSGSLFVLQMYSNLRRDGRIDDLHRQLEFLCEELTKQLKPRLHGQMQEIVTSYLPQTWVFETELGECTIFIAADGNARVWRGADQNRDVTLQWRYDALAKVLKSRDRSSVEPGDYPNVFVQTEKGRAGFNYLKREFGL